MILAITLVIVSAYVGLNLHYYKTKTNAMNEILHHPELSDDKARSITEMMAKPHKKFH